MKLSPLDIKRQQFGKAFRGYDPDEVDAFVKQVASQWESVLDELRLATERNRELEQKLKHYERVELALQEALETARETARRSEEAAERKAKIIVEQAELKAQRTLQDVEQERFGLRRDIAKLTGRQNEVAARLRAFLMSELEILAQFQGDDPVGFIRLESARSRSEPEQLQAHQPTSLPTSDELIDPENDLESSSEAAFMEAPEMDVPEMSSEDATLASETVDGAHLVENRGETVETTEEAYQAEPPVSEAPQPPEGEDTTPTDEKPSTSLSALDADPQTMEPEPFDWEVPETVEPEPQSDRGSDWNLRTLVTGETESVAGSEAERERIRRILEDLD